MIYKNIQGDWFQIKQFLKLAELDVTLSRLDHTKMQWQLLLMLCCSALSSLTIVSKDGLYLIYAASNKPVGRVMCQQEFSLKVATVDNPGDSRTALRVTS